ncbi:MAG TPA: hypothetical protein VKS79_15465 [Gemmataceae bacterium]|nr:hypothetical protein [Gemmataceae bacterium]
MCKPGRFGLFVLAMLVSANLAQGQEASPLGPPKIYSKTVSFRLPVQIDERERSGLRELKLFVRTPSTNWMCKETAPATQKGFSFRAPSDGEYWFIFVMVDSAGKAHPEHVEQAQPGLVVVVDTQVPEVEVRSVNGVNGQVYLYGTILDANPDYNSMKMDYFENGQWKPLTMLADCPGAFLDTDPKAPGGKVRVYAADRAGNSVTREVELRNTAASIPPAPMVESAAVASVPFPATSALTMPPALTPPAVPLPGPGPIPPAIVRPNLPSASPSPVAGELKEIPELPNGSDVRVISDPVPPAKTPHETSSKTTLILKEVAAPSNVPVVNSLKCRLDFTLDPKAERAPVEVWATADGSKTWTKCGESAQGKSPVVVTLPQDGVYGFLFAALSEGSNPSPRPGTMPDAWVEVDTTKPTVEIQSIQMGVGSEAGDLFITWQARDRNLQSEPVSIYFATQSTGQWYPIAQNLANSGKHSWTVPSGLARVFIRVEVTDKAGNMTRVETPEAIQVECARVPVKVLNIVPVTGNEK